MTRISGKNVSEPGVKKTINKNKPSIKSKGNGGKEKAQKAFSTKKSNNQKGTGMIYIGHIPHGFYEDQMTEYFNQFGKVIAAVVSRSKKTGRSKGFGFVEFEDKEVAKIAAETMNNYLMYNRILKCRYIPPEERKGRLFVQSFTRVPRFRNRLNNFNKKYYAFKNLSSESYKKKTDIKMKQFKKFFEERGIDFTCKVEDKNSLENNEMKTSNCVTEACETSNDSDSEDKNDELGVLEIDESDNEIHFKTPPKVKKVIKKTCDLKSKKNQIHDEKKINYNRKKNSNLQESSQNINAEYQNTTKKKLSTIASRTTEIENTKEQKEKIKNRKKILKSSGIKKKNSKFKFAGKNAPHSVNKKNQTKRSLKPSEKV